ncbi:hypothetical protein ACQKMD_01060 [Viridibacillus sp. NPDC096237]
MMKSIQYLQESPASVQLSKNNKLSVVGVTALQLKPRLSKHMIVLYA